MGSASSEVVPDSDDLPETSLECVGVVEETMALRPAVMDAELEHTIVQKHSLSNASRSKKGLMTVRTNKNPEAEMLRRQQDRSEALRRERKNREGDEGAFMRRNQRDLAYQKNAAYLEGDGSSESDEDEMFSDESDVEVSQQNRFTRSSRKRGRQDDEEGDGDELQQDADSGNLELSAKVAKITKEASSSGALAATNEESDSDDDDGGVLVGNKGQRQADVSAMLDDDEEED